MLKNRIIPCLDIKDGRTVKGINFNNLTDAGNPVELARQYALQNADELVFLDITATEENRNTWVNLVKEIAREINIPFTVGGGIRSVEDARKLLQAGADKISVNSAAVKRPALIRELALEFGNQCVVVAIDTKKVNHQHVVFIQGGKTSTSLYTLDWAQQIEQLGGGEILLTSMQNDGTQSGFDLEITREVCQQTNLPVIASGGAGTLEDFETVFRNTNASGALAASVFHYGKISVPTVKNFLQQQNIPVRL